METLDPFHAPSFRTSALTAMNLLHSVPVDGFFGEAWRRWTQGGCVVFVTGLFPGSHLCVVEVCQCFISAADGSSAAPHVVQTGTPLKSGPVPKREVRAEG